MKLWKWAIGGLAVTGLGFACFYNSVYGWHATSDLDDELGMEFRFLGCNDWPENRPYETSISVGEESGKTVYAVTNPETCGYSIKNPRYKVSGETLRLSYELFTKTGELAACICEYKSEFRFRDRPPSTKVVFDAR